ncbi:MAG: hypothetical protein QM586_09330 [Xenophilus sp.]
MRAEKHTPPPEGAVDIMMSVHQDVFMRTTIDLPDDLHRIASSLARHNGRSLGQTVAELMRRGLTVQASRADAPQAAFRMDGETGLPVILGATRPMSEDDVRALENEA